MNAPLLNIRLPVQGTSLVLVPASAQPCGVGSFARHLAKIWRELGAHIDELALPGTRGDFIRIWRALATVDSLIVNLPIVAWKKLLLMPLAALLFARLRGKRTVLILHEWADLDWRRRAIYMIYAPFAQQILFSSPTIRDQFHRSARLLRAIPSGVVPIPPNIRKPATLHTSQTAPVVADERAKGKLVLGQFGSIYPKKQSDIVLDIAAALKRLGQPVFVVFIGGFVKGLDRVEEDFRAKIASLGLEDDVWITGYIDSEERVFSLFQSIDVFAYSFAEGLTSRRGSVLACLQSGRPIVVNAPKNADEFNHHRAYRAAIDDSLLHFVPAGAQVSTYAGEVLAAYRMPKSRPQDFFDQCWRDAAHAVAARALLSQHIGALMEMVL